MPKGIYKHKPLKLETKIKIGNHFRGKHPTKKTIEKMKIAQKGRTFTDTTKKKMSDTHKTLVGEKAANWKGGITPVSQKIRNSIELRLWREAVFARDNWTCQDCGDNRGGNLNAHHKKSFSKYPELRTAIENGITLCNKCHTKLHKC